MPSLSKSLLLIGASRGLGFAMAEEYLRRGWRVIATARATSANKLHRLAETSAGALEVETVDITVPEQIVGLRQRLENRPSLPDRPLDMLFVNAGVSND